MFTIYFSHSKEDHSGKTSYVQTKEYFNALLSYIALNKCYPHVSIYDDEDNLVIKHYKFDN